MMPQLFQSGSLTIQSYGFFIVLGFLAAVRWTTLLMQREGISAAKTEGLGLVTIISSGIGSKVLTEFDYPGFYSDSNSSFLWGQVTGRGGVFYGGFLLAIAATVLYCRLVRLSWWHAADGVAPALALAQGLGRVGCFLAGCCWGVPTNLPFGTTFRSELAHETTGVPLHLRLHPTQLYEAALLFFSIPFLLALRRKRVFHGEVILVYLLYYAVARFLLEFLRADPRGHHLGGLLSTSQLIALLIIPVAVVLFLSRSKEGKSGRGQALKTALVVEQGPKNNFAGGRI